MDLRDAIAQWAAANARTSPLVGVMPHEDGEIAAQVAAYVDLVPSMLTVASFREDIVRRAARINGATD